ncbi:MAG: lipopolysaccharide biosynthesis protein [Deltaproteobacteria bacterium]|nr:lipopolysaccharide biosynthesis protein [Deltaproteobacteria bacterium]MBZ0219095.1 lipopolysaccharide biosynthesis protein [Deltaproteobacteria bacterium]
MEDRRDELTLHDYISVISRRRKMIGAVTASAFIIAIIASLLLPKQFASTASIMPPQDDSLLGSMAGLSQVPGVAALSGSFLGLKSPSDLWVGILKSQSVSDPVIERFGLRELYGRKTLEETRLALTKRVRIEKSKEEIISIKVFDRSPERAAQMANAFVEELDRVLGRSAMTSGQRMRAFSEKRLKEARQELERIEAELRAFQEKHKTVNLDSQSKAIIEAIGTVKGELMAKEVELTTLLSFATEENPMAGVLKAEVEGLRGKLRELETGRPAARDIFIPTDNIPGISFKYANLLRDAKVQQTLFELLTQQYEIARIQEAKDSPTVQVLDIAKPSDKKARPKRALIVVSATVSAFVFSLFAAFFVEFIEASRKRGEALVSGS